MITKQQLEDLGYSVKTKMLNNSIDFIHQNPDFEPQKVNLNDGILQIIHGANTNGKTIIFRDIKEFELWLDK